MLAQAAKSWISSPLGVNLLLSQFKDSKETVEKFTKISYLLKEKTECSTKTKVFSTNNNLIGLLKDHSSVEQLNNLQHAVSIWVNSHKITNVNLETLIPETAEFILMNMSTFKDSKLGERRTCPSLPWKPWKVIIYESAWITTDQKSGAMMKIYNSFSYTEDIKYEARILELPLRDEDFKLVIIVPNEVDLLHVLFRRLANDGLRAAVRNIQPLFIVSSKLLAPSIEFHSEGAFQEEIRQLGKVTITHNGSISVNEQGIDIKVLSCIYPTPTASRLPKADLQKTDPPFFFGLLFQDTPIFVGQFSKI